MAESKLRDLSTDFAVKIIKLCETIKGHYSLTNQLERSATSIGANIHEANYAHGKPDFISKLQIALKECYETEYWLELFVNPISSIVMLQKTCIINAARSATSLSHPSTPQKKNNGTPLPKHICFRDFFFSRVNYALFDRYSLRWVLPLRNAFVILKLYG